MTLSTKTPKDFFTKHRLLLHVARSEMDRVRVFQAMRECPCLCAASPCAPQTPLCGTTPKGLPGAGL